MAYAVRCLHLNHAPSDRHFSVIDGLKLQVSASLGIALYPQDGEELDELMPKADSAMFMQKAAMLMLR